MNNTRKSQPVKLAPKNEWLAIVDALNRLMEGRILRADGCEPRSKHAFGKKTLAALNEAYAATLHYYAYLQSGETRNLKAESAISGLWRRTGRLLRTYDPALSARLTAHKAFWSRESTWSTAAIQKAWAGLNAIRVNANIMDPDRKTLERWSTSR